MGRLGRPSVSDPWGVGSFLSLGRPTCVRCPGPLGSCSPVRPLGALRCVCGVLGHLAPVHRCACSVRCFACAVSWVTWLLFTGVPAWFVVLRLRCPGPLGSCSRVRPLGVLCCVWGVLGHLAPVHRCARSVCCVACAVSWAPWLLFSGVPAQCVALRVRCPGPLGSCSPVCPLGVLCCVCGVLGHLAPVHRCARVVCCVASAVSWATWLLFTGVPARCVVLRVRCPGPLGSCSLVCPLRPLLCSCGVLGHWAPAHRCARSVFCFACAVSWATWLLFTGVPARCAALCVRCPGPLGSCSPVCQAVVSRPFLPSVHVRVRCPGPRGACSPVCALCAVRVCRWWLCPSSSAPNFLFCFCFFFFLCRASSFFFFLEKRGRAYTAGTGMGNWCSGAIVLCSLACVVGALVAAAPQGCGSRVLMYTGTGQGGFG